MIGNNLAVGVSIFDPQVGFRVNAFRAVELGIRAEYGRSALGLGFLSAYLPIAPKRPCTHVAYIYIYIFFFIYLYLYLYLYSYIYIYMCLIKVVPLIATFVPKVYAAEVYMLRVLPNSHRA